MPCQWRWTVVRLESVIRVQNGTNIFRRKGTDRKGSFYRRATLITFPEIQFEDIQIVQRIKTVWNKLNMAIPSRR